MAFQTKHPALNAAVEAARAGEAGMGFAVVADKVRHLAQRCAHAARDTADLIEESISKSDTGKNYGRSSGKGNWSCNRAVNSVEDLRRGDRARPRSAGEGNRTDRESHVANGARNPERCRKFGRECASSAEQLNAQSEALKSVVFRLLALVGTDRGQ